MFAILQMLNLKVIDLSIRLEKLTQSTGDLTKDFTWERKFYDLYKNICSREKKE